MKATTLLIDPSCFDNSRKRDVGGKWGAGNGTIYSYLGSRWNEDVGGKWGVVVLLKMILVSQI